MSYQNGTLARLPGVDLWFTDSGGDGPAVVLLHANTGTAESWEPQSAAFSSAGYRVITFDRRGWGRSIAKPERGPQPASVADDLDALTDHMGLSRFHLVGVAGGGFVALDYAAWRPEKLRSLVVAASTGQVAEPEIDAFIATIEIPELRRQSAIYREIGASYRGSSPDGVRRWLEIHARSMQKGAAVQPMRTPNTFRKIEGIEVPTLAILADAALVAPPALRRIWIDHMSNCECATILDAGHSVAWEQTEEFNRVVLDFLARRDGVV